MHADVGNWQTADLQFKYFEQSPSLKDSAKPLKGFRLQEFVNQVGFDSNLNAIRIKRVLLRKQNLRVFGQVDSVTTKKHFSPLQS